MAQKNFNGRAHWEKTRGSDLEAAQYCMKDETHPQAPTGGGGGLSRSVRRGEAEKN